MQDLLIRDTTALIKLQLAERSFSGSWHLRYFDLLRQSTSGQHSSAPFSGIGVCGQDLNHILLRAPFGSLFLHFSTHVPSFYQLLPVFLHLNFLKFLILKESSNVLLEINWYLFLRKKPIEAMTQSIYFKKSKKKSKCRTFLTPHAIVLQIMPSSYSR